MEATENREATVKGFCNQPIQMTGNLILSAESRSGSTAGYFKDNRVVAQSGIDAPARLPAVIALSFSGPGRSLMLLSFILLILAVYYNLRQIRIIAAKDQQLFAMEKDLSERNFCLGQINEEKDWLVKEIHHRVKNNLQIIISLLNTQSSYLTNTEAREAIRNSQHRMFALSLIHQKLYQADSLSSIDTTAYIQELISYLLDEYDGEDRVSMQLDLAPLHLDVSLAVPFGLIVNEAVSNTLKYAFPGKAKGAIKLSIRSTDQINYVMEIADDGIGLPHDYDPDTSGSLGTILMKGLSRQLGGQFEIRNADGVMVSLHFKQVANPFHLTSV